MGFFNVYRAVKKILLPILLILFSYQIAKAQKVEVINFEDLQEKISYAEAPLTVFNFWATWCGPCVKELPYFQSIDREYDQVKVYLVSVDFKNQMPRLEQFVSDKGLTSTVLFLDEKDPDLYMQFVSKSWSGAIPATLFVTDLGKKMFHETSFEKQELEKLVKQYLN